MRYAALTLTLALCASLASAQEPAPRPTVDQLAGRIADLRAKRAEIDKQETAAVSELKSELKRQNDLIEKLGLLDGPGPRPVVPPEPKPAPVDPLRAKLKAALEASAGTSADKVEWARDLAALYRAAAKLAGDATLPTASALRQKLRDASAALIGADSLKEVRQAVAVELAAVLPTTDADLSDGQRAAAAALFVKLAGMLEEIAK